MYSDDLFLDGLTPRVVDDEARDKSSQVEATIEAIAEGSEVVLGILAVLQGVEGAGQAGLEVAEHGVDPLELRQVTRLERADHHRHVHTAGIGDCGEAAQTVAENRGLRRQACLGPLTDRFAREAADQVELQVSRVASVIDGDSGHERHLVLGAPSGFAAGALAAEVGIVKLHDAAELMGVVLRGHGAIDLLMQEPGGVVALTQLALQGQRRQPGLGLADEVDREEPGAQRQLGVLHQAARRQRSLMPAAIALEQLAAAVPDDIVLSRVAPRAPKSARPSRSLDRLGAPRFGPKAAKEFGDGHAVLKLDAVEVLRARSVFKVRPRYDLTGSQGEPAEARF